MSGYSGEDFHSVFGYSIIEHRLEALRNRVRFLQSQTSDVDRTALEPGVELLKILNLLMSADHRLGIIDNRFSIIENQSWAEIEKNGIDEDSLGIHKLLETIEIRLSKIGYEVGVISTDNGLT